MKKDDKLFATQCQNTIKVSSNDLSIIFPDAGPELLKVMANEAVCYPKGLEVVIEGYNKSKLNTVVFKIIRGNVTIGLADKDQKNPFFYLLGISGDLKDINSVIVLSLKNERAPFSIKTTSDKDVVILQLSKEMVLKMIEGNPKMADVFVGSQINLISRLASRYLELTFDDSYWAQVRVIGFIFQEISKVVHPNAAAAILMSYGEILQQADPKDLNGSINHGFKVSMAKLISRIKDFEFKTDLLEKVFLALARKTLKDKKVK